MKKLENGFTKARPRRYFPTEDLHYRNTVP